MARAPPCGILSPTCSSAPRPRIRGLRPIGWRSTDQRPTICARRSIGHFHLTATRQIGIALTAAAVPLWMHLSLLEECRRRVEQALAALATVGRAGCSPRDEASCRLGRVSTLYQRRRSRSSRGLDEGPGACEEPRRYGVPQALALGLVVLSRQRWSIIAPLGPWRTGSLLWWRRAPTRTIGLLASG